MNDKSVNMKPVFMSLGLMMAVQPILVDADELADIKIELKAIRSEYQQRIESLEKRLALAEQKLADAPAAQLTSPAAETKALTASDAYASGGSGLVSAVNQFNPSIGIILDGELWAYDQAPGTHSIPGFALGGESGLADRGLSLGESELVFSANVDDWFYAQVTAAIAQENGAFNIGLEEAYLETLSLPASTTLRVGRFFSGVGYLNDKHKHTWDFADQALPYRAFMGEQYGDDGIQFRWLAPTDFFLELGGEMLRGGSYPAAGSVNSGFGSKSLFAHIGADVGFSHSWLAGISWLHTHSKARQSGDEDAPLLFSGHSTLYIADFIWKWAPNGNVHQRNFKFQSEFLWRNEDGQVSLPGVARSASLNQDALGWYAQAIYQWQPRWRVGLRVDGLHSDHPGTQLTATALDSRGHTPRRYSVMLDYSNSEFSRLRLQYNRDESGLASDNQIGLQYIMSIGAHGAHEF